MSAPSEVLSRHNVSCPFCGLACDDLEVRIDGTAATVTDKGCPRSVALFATQSAASGSSALLAGAPVPLATACGAAADILKASRQPLIGGMGTDVGGVRAALQLADRSGAIVDHMNTRGLMRNLMVLRDSGWMASTFAEVRTRADFVLIVGTDGISRFPRVIERLVTPVDSPFSDTPIRRQVVYLGAEPGTAIDGLRTIACPKERLGEVFAALRGLLAGRALQAARVAGIDIETLRSLAEEMRAARYGVIAWAAADLDLANAELIIQSICALVADLNESTRFGGLPLGGNDGDVTANQVTVWQTGFPLRSGFGRGVPEYDPYHFGSDALLASGNADALLWISSFDPQRLPPATTAPTIVLGSPAMQFSTPPAVFIPVATPGLHHAGHFFRSDSVMAVRLRKLCDSPLPSVAQALAAIEQAL